MTKYEDHRDDYLPLQANVICLLALGVVSVAFL